MLFVRIGEGNLTKSGIRTRKLYFYEPLEWGHGKQYDFAKEETYKKFNYGSYYKDKNFILMKWQKFQILEELDKIFGKENYCYVFE